MSLHEIADEPFVEYKTGHPLRKTNADILGRAGIQPNIVCEVEEPAAMMSLVQAGLEKRYLSLAARKFQSFLVEYFAENNERELGAI
ncbi:LysR substrate-binding domain-containing protein [Brevibacillus invocatus]|uniref:LysR substrate-binding domain-containing protein n=1 Tax=Brevibacillus invocatus TaxID=173959 RepID=UPI00203FB5D3|nr:LysR substrate-binding domain-containing protein [Brevibacillus invocatus]